MALLAPLVLEACDDLAAGGAGDVARRVRGCIDAGTRRHGVAAGRLVRTEPARHSGESPARGDRPGRALARGRARGGSRRPRRGPDAAGGRDGRGRRRRRAGRVAARLLPRLRILAGVRRGMRRDGPAALLVLRVRLAGAGRPVHVLSGTTTPARPGSPRRRARRIGRPCAPDAAAISSGWNRCPRRRSNCWRSRIWRRRPSTRWPPNAVSAGRRCRISADRTDCRVRTLRRRAPPFPRREAPGFGRMGGPGRRAGGRRCSA